MESPNSKRLRQNLEELMPESSYWWLLESAPDGIVLVDEKGIILLVNTQAERLFGYTEDELVGEPIEVLIPERYHGKHAEHRAHYMENPRTRPMGVGLELYGKRRDGSIFPVEISLSPVQTRQGLLVMAIIRDVTDYTREHFISETLQKALLSPTPGEIPGLTIASAYHSAYAGAMVGGDFFDVLTIRPGLVGIAAGDVSGKGIEASVYTALAKYSLRAYAYQDPTPSSVLEKLNKAVYNQSEPDSFITLFYGLLDVEEHTISFANAGHMSPLRLTHPGHIISDLTIIGLPLGVLPDSRYEQHITEVKCGDRLLLYSDGVTEARSDTDLYGVENLTEFFRKNGDEEPDEFINHLINTLDAWSRGKLQDDVTVLLVVLE